MSREFQRSFVPKTALAQSVRFDKMMMHVDLMDGRVISVPLAWFPMLKRAKPKERNKVEIGGGGVALHWPDLDEAFVDHRPNGGGGHPIFLKPGFVRQMVNRGAL